MKIRNKLSKAICFPFACRGTKMLKPGELSRSLPVMTFYDEDLQRSLSRGSIEVLFEESDASLAAIQAVPGANRISAPITNLVDLVFSKLGPPEKPEGQVIADDPSKTQKEPPKVIASVSKPRPKPKPPRSPMADHPGPRDIRASHLARELHIPFHVLSARLSKEYGKSFYPQSGVSPEQAEAMREHYAEKLELPELSKEPQKGRHEARTLSELSARVDGVVSLDDLFTENAKGGGK